MASVELKEEEEIEVAPAPPPLQPTGKLVLDIDISDATIEDMQKIDRMGVAEAGAFADAVDVMARFVTNLDIRKRPRREMKAIAKAIMEQFKEESNPGN